MAAEVNEKNEESLDATKEAKESKPSIWPQVKFCAYLSIRKLKTIKSSFSLKHFKLLVRLGTIDSFTHRQ